jgi:hypothetical protein
LTSGDGGQDGDDEPADAVTGHVATEVDHVQRDVALLQVTQHPNLTVSVFV